MILFCYEVRLRKGKSSQKKTEMKGFFKCLSSQCNIRTIIIAHPEIFVISVSLKPLKPRKDIY